VFRDFSFDNINLRLLRQESSNLPDFLLGAINKELEKWKNKEKGKGENVS
jgi:hypothetical protein